MSRKNPIPIFGGNLPLWADKVVGYLRTLEVDIATPSPKIVQLERRQDIAKATTDGLLMFDATLGIPVYSYNGAWHSVLDGSVV